MDALLNQLSEWERQSLLACAVPDWFDGAILAALLQNKTQGCVFVATLPQFEFVQQQEGAVERYILEPTVRTALLNTLKNAQMQLYLTYQTRAFYYFATQMTASAGEVRFLAEHALMNHLTALFPILIDSNELTELSQLLAQATSLTLAQQEHCHQLRYFQACVANERGQYNEAEDQLRWLIVEPNLTKQLHARSLTALGHIYDYRGQFDRALTAHRESANIYRQLGDIIGESKALKNEGIVCHELARYEQARTLFERSYLLTQQANDLRLQGLILLELGYTTKELGLWDETMDYYQKSLAIWQQMEIRDAEAKVYNNLGEVNLLIGRWSEAETCYKQALALSQNERETADMLYNLGFLYAAQDRYEQAHHLYVRALSLAQKINNLAAISQIHYRLGDLHQRQGELRQAYHAYEQAITTIELMRGQVVEEEIRISVFGIRQYVYEAMVLLCLDLGQPAMALSYVEQAKARAFLDRLIQSKLQSARQGELANEIPLTAEQIQAQLPPQTALIEYFSTGSAGPAEPMLAKLPATSHLRKYLLPPERLLAFVVTNDILNVFDLGVSIHQLEAQYFYHTNMRLRGTTPTPGQILPIMRRWHNLDRQLLEPLRLQLAEKQHLFLVPHSLLHYLPLHALRPDHPFARSTLTISYAPSASVLLKSSLATQSKRADGECLAIGVDSDGLEHAEAEAQWVATQLSGHALLGQSATLDGVCTALGTANIVHFACHGHFRRTMPMNSALALADGELTAAKILQEVRCDADIITLSACDTGLNYLAYGDELLGMVRACLCAGARALVVTLWQVHDIPTRLFMERFYQVWQTGAARAAALVEAQWYLRTLTGEQIRTRLIDYRLAPAQIEGLMKMFSTMMPGPNPFDHPYYWGAFLLIGDPR